MTLWRRGRWTFISSVVVGLVMMSFMGGSLLNGAKGGPAQIVREGA
jgi:hypothetical protein